MTTAASSRPFAVVTDASSGSGYELARQFVDHGYDLLIAAEDAGIDRSAADLRRDSGPTVQAVQVDLGRSRSTMPGSFQAVYNASKSSVQSFAQAVRDELKDTGVTVTSLMPGPTDTHFFERADMTDTKVGARDKDDPAKVAEQGFEALTKGDDQVVAGSLKNKAQATAAKVIPDTVKAGMHRKMAEPGSAS
jgi:short-subunit dehydrogenase